MQNFNRNQPGRTNNRNRVNDEIRVPQVRVVRDGEQLGIMPTYNARRMATEAGLDLVEIAPTARPPVCHIMDYGKYRYDQTLREKSNRKKQKIVQDKEIRFSPVTGEHDIETKVNQAKEFLTKGSRVNLVVKFHRRQIVHPDLGYEILNKVVELLADVGVVLDQRPRIEGKTLTCRMEPKKGKESR